jgi:hypothetical protein
VTGIPTSWDPDADASVYAVAVVGNTVFAGGYFSNIGTTPRRGIAAIDAVSGSALAWNANANGDVFALAVPDEGVSPGTIVAAGRFTSIGGGLRSKVAVLSRTTAAASSWNPLVTTSSNWVDELLCHDRTLYRAGFFSMVFGTYANVVAVDLLTAENSGWDVDPNSPARALGRNASSLFVGGYYTSIGGETREGFAEFAVDEETSVIHDPVPGETTQGSVAGPVSFAVSPGWPNPFQESTAIFYELPAGGRVRVEIFDLSGRRIAVLFDGTRAAGRHTVKWDGHGADGRRTANGIYFCRVEVHGEARTIKLSLLH